MVWQSFSASVVGSSHTRHGTDIQDRAASYDNAKLSLAVVADGYGADECFRSAEGAKIAVTCAINALHDFIIELEPRFPASFRRKASPAAQGEFEKLLRGLVNHIVAQWHDGVDRHIQAAPFTAEELEKAGEKYRARYEAGELCAKAYGATLIAAAVTKHYWFGIHIGDGRFTALYRDGGFD